MSDPKTNLKLAAYIARVAELSIEGRTEVQEALRLIQARAPAAKDPLPLQLLALRRYLRMGGKKVHASWAWTQA
jgi:hypothetical protein